MAEDEEVGGASAPAGGSVLKKYGPLAAIVLLAQVVLAWVVIKITSPASTADQDTGDPLIPQAQTQIMEDTDEATGLPFVYQNEALGKMTFNPAETNSERFMVLDFQLGLMAANDDGESMTPAEIAGDAASIALIDANIALIKSTSLRVLRTKTIDDLESDNIEEVWKDLKSRLNEDVFSKIQWSDDGESKKKVAVQSIISTNIIIQ